MIETFDFSHLSSEDLIKAINTTGAFDTLWLKNELLNWNADKEQEKAVFMEHMYQCAGRNNPKHPMHGLFTGLWENFCITEAGPYCRDKYFDMLEAVRLYEEQQKVEFTITT
jgi:hypothetical protein